MWPFKRKCTPAEAQEIADDEAGILIRRHEDRNHRDRCPLCHAQVSERRSYERPGIVANMARFGRQMQGIEDDGMTIFACGSKRVRKDGVTKFVARCLTVKS